MTEQRIDPVDLLAKAAGIRREADLLWDEAACLRMDMVKHDFAKRGCEGPTNDSTKDQILELLLPHTRERMAGLREWNLELRKASEEIEGPCREVLYIVDLGARNGDERAVHEKFGVTAEDAAVVAERALSELEAAMKTLDSVECAGGPLKGRI